MTARARRTACVALAAAIALLTPTTGTAGQLSAAASCPDGQHLVVDWGWYEDPGMPTAVYPDWVGFDIYRRDLVACTPWVRVNDAPYPRVAGQSQTGRFSEVAPALNTTFQYQVIPVDASHQRVILSSIDCNPPCVPQTWASCPEGSGVLTIGTIVDWGWTVFIQPCGDGCWPSFYVGNSPIVGELRAYAGTGATFAFYGGAGCGSIEGCAIIVSHYEPAGCGPTPTTRPSWGHVKTRYR